MSFLKKFRLNFRFKNKISYWDIILFLKKNFQQNYK